MQVGSEAMLWRTVRAGFALRRKTLVNSLRTGFPLPKGPAGGHRHRLRPAGNVRGERLSHSGLCRPGRRAGPGDGGMRPRWLLPLLLLSAAA